MKKTVTSQALKVTNKHLNKDLYERTKRMKRVITYGTFDLLHYGHIELLKRAKALGDYLIVVLSTDEFNWNENHLQNCATCSTFSSKHSYIISIK